MDFPDGIHQLRVINNSCLQEAKKELNRIDPNSHPQHRLVENSPEEEKGWAQGAGQPKLLQHKESSSPQCSSPSQAEIRFSKDSGVSKSHRHHPGICQVILILKQHWNKAL